MKSRISEDGPRPEPDLAAAVVRCRTHATAMAKLQQIYGDVKQATVEAGLKCLGGGACCRFDLSGHRLYLSVLELSLLTTQPPPNPAQARRMRCPYQVGPACAAYPRRPLGCRTFFCRPEAQPLLQSLYERSHRRIRQLHQTYAIPYAYVEACATLHTDVVF